MTESMPWRWSRWTRNRPAGPAPTIPTCVRVGIISAGSWFDRSLVRYSARMSQPGSQGPLRGLADAISELVRDGDTVALEGFTHLIPFAAGHEIIRQKRRGLTLIRMTPDLLYDQMIGAGCAHKLVFSWGGNPGVGSLHRLRDAVERQWPHALEI